MDDSQFDWKAYELEIEEHYRLEYPSAQITANTKLRGRFSKIDRQIDLLIEQHAADFAFRVIVDAKHYGTRIDVKDVEQFMGLLRDVGVDIGVMIAPEGYTQAAINRAYYDNSRVELDVLNFKELKQFQCPGGIPYSGDKGVFVPAPLGWVVDAGLRGFTYPDGEQAHFLAALYQRGRTFQAAVSASEWMYMKIWTKQQPALDLESLLAYQQGYMLKCNRENKKISVLADDVKRADGAATKIRLLEVNGLPIQEYTGFIDFEEFIFMCVLFTPHELRGKNLRKLRYILRLAVPVRLKYETNDFASRRRQPISFIVPGAGEKSP